ncbi:MAG: hypothetical protein WKF84_23515 [Pyrinomonadaceae bacterium]
MNNHMPQRRKQHLKVILVSASLLVLAAFSFIVRPQDQSQKTSLQGTTREVNLTPNTTVDAGEIKLQSDRDHDGMSDEDEAQNGTNPDDAADADADVDGDGVSNGDEVAAGSNLNSGDSDGDGVPDSEEIRLGYNPNDPNNRPPAGATLVRLELTPNPLALSLNSLLGQDPVQLKVTGILSDNSQIDLTRAPGTTYQSPESDCGRGGRPGKRRRCGARLDIHRGRQRLGFRECPFGRHELHAARLIVCFDPRLRQ